MEIVPTRHFLEILDELPHELREMAFEKAKKYYPDADPAALRAHIAHAMRNELVISWLEAQE